MTAVARAREAPPRRDPDIAQLLDWADHAIARLDAEPEPLTPREWAIGHYRQHVGFVAGDEHGYQRAIRELADQLHDLYLHWLAVTARQNGSYYGGYPGIDDPRFHRWVDQRHNPQKRR